MSRAERARQCDRRACARTLAMLADIDGDGELPDLAAAHLRRCYRCRREAVHYRDLRFELADLATTGPTPDPSVLATVLASLDSYDARIARRAAAMVRAAVVGGVLAVGAASAAGAFVVRGRRQRLATAG